MNSGAKEDMMNKKKTARAPRVPNVVNNESGHRQHQVSNCHIENKSAETNEHTRAAVEALSKACEANAKAIEACAHALRGGDVTMGAGIRVG